MQNELDAYFEHLRSARQLSGHSLDGYRRDLNKLLTYCERENIAEWNALQGANWSASCIARASPAAAWRACSHRCAASTAT